MNITRKNLSNITILDWKDLSNNGFTQIQRSLKDLNFFLYEEDMGNDSWTLILSNTPLTKREITRKVKEAFKTEVFNFKARI